MNHELLSSYTETNHVPCGRCRSVLPSVKIWRAIFLGEGIAESDDELIQLNVVTCSSCGHRAAMGALLVVIDQAASRVIVLRPINFVEEEAYELTQQLLDEYVDRIPTEELTALRSRIIIALDRGDFSKLLASDPQLFQTLVRQSKEYYEYCRLPVSDRIEKMLDEMKAGHGILLRECDAEPCLLGAVKTKVEEFHKTLEDTSEKKAILSLLNSIQIYFDRCRKPMDSGADDNNGTPPPFVEVTDEEKKLLEEREGARQDGNVVNETTALLDLGRYYLQQRLPRHVISLGEQLSCIIYPSEVRRLRAQAFELMGQGLKLLGLSEEAFYHFNHALKILYSEGGDLFLVLSIQRQMCRILEDQGQYHAAMSLYKYQLDVLRKHAPSQKLRDNHYFIINGDPSSDYRHSLVGLANIHMTLGQSTEAVPYLREAVDLANIDSPEKLVDLQINLANALISSDSGSTEKVGLRWNEGITILKKNLDGNVPLASRLQSLINLAAAYHRINQRREAISWLDRYFEELGSSSASQSSHDIGAATILHAAAFDHEIATDTIKRNDLLARIVQLLEACCQRLKSNYGVQSIFANSALALAYERCGRFQEAMIVYGNLGPLYEGLRRTTIDYNVRLTLQRTMAAAMVRAARCCLRLLQESNSSGKDWVTESFRFVEASRSRLLLDDVAQDATATQALPSLVLNGEELRIDTNSAQLIDIEGIKNKLKEGEVILEFSLIQNIDEYEGSWVVFSVDREGVSSEIHHFPLETVYKAVRNLQGLYHQSLEKGFAYAEAREAWYQALKTLSELIIVPGLISKEVKRVIVSPEVYLFDVPWLAIVAERIDTSVRPTVVVTPSSNVVAALRRSFVAADRRVCLVETITGVGSYNIDPFRSCAMELSKTLCNLSSDYQYEFNETLGIESSRSNLHKSICDAGLFLYFGHGIASEDSTCLFCVENDNAVPVPMEEIAELSLKEGCVVILLACWSQSHDTESQFTAREIKGLGETLLRCGASAVVGFLEPVQVMIATTMGLRIAGHFLEGETIDRAVLYAMNELRETTDDPSLSIAWSGIVLLGDGQARMSELCDAESAPKLR